MNAKQQGTKQGKELKEVTEHVVSFSGGKDSTAMLLLMLEKQMPVDEIIFIDTGMEFPAMYDHIDRVEQYIGRKITRLKNERGFMYWFAEREKKSGKRIGEKGYGWPDFRNRWCTKALKQEIVKRHLRGRTAVEYHGIAADEMKRTQNNKDKDVRYPLVDWGMEEADCLAYCYDHGFDWGGLYRQFRRVSCWCCPLRSIAGDRALYTHHPDLWERLEEMDKMSFRTYKPRHTVKQLAERFEAENRQVRMGVKA